MKDTLLLTLLALPLSAQTFDSVSIKPAAENAHIQGLNFMIPMGSQALPHGLLTMTGPLPPFLVYAYGVQDEVEARAMRSRLPDWAQHTNYTIVARLPEGAATSGELRIMLRNALEDRFAVKAHRETHIGPVNMLILSKQGATGPDLTQHTDAGCTPAGIAQEAGKQVCGFEIRRREGGLVHVSMIDVTMEQVCTQLGGIAGVLGARSMDQVRNATGLTGKWDLTLEFVSDQSDGQASDTGGPSFTRALEKQLGLRLKKATDTLEDLVIDHIQQPTAD